MRIIVILLIAAFLSGCILPSSKHVCPDGSAVDSVNACNEAAGKMENRMPEDNESAHGEGQETGVDSPAKNEPPAENTTQTTEIAPAGPDELAGEEAFSAVFGTGIHNSKPTGYVKLNITENISMVIAENEMIVVFFENATASQMARLRDDELSKGAGEVGWIEGLLAVLFRIKDGEDLAEAIKSAESYPGVEYADYNVAYYEARDRR